MEPGTMSLPPQMPALPAVQAKGGSTAASSVQMRGGDSSSAEISPSGSASKRSFSLPSEKRLVEAEKKLNQKDLSLEYELSPAGELEAMKIIDKSTKEVLLQIPPESMKAVIEQIDKIMEKLQSKVFPMADPYKAANSDEVPSGTILSRKA